MSIFKKATRGQKKARMLLRGPSGSGKTYSSLMLAQALGKKVAMIDTEKKSSTHYSDTFNFDFVDYNELYEDHNPDNYIDMIKAVESEGYDVLIIDSISHVWFAKGGILELNNKIAKADYKGFTFPAWDKTNRKYYYPLVDALINNNNIHIITTGRTKQEYEVTKEQGETKVNKLGTKTVQRDGLDYEFDTVLDLKHGEEGFATADKDRTRQYHEDGEIITEKVGLKFKKYYDSAKLAPISEAKIKIKEAKGLVELKKVFQEYVHLKDKKTFMDLMAKRKAAIQMEKLKAKEK